MNATPSWPTYAPPPIPPAIGDRPLLLVAPTHDTPDEDIAMHRRLAGAVKAAGGRHVQVVTYDDDHPFSAHRLELAETLVHWLRTSCTPASR